MVAGSVAVDTETDGLSWSTDELRLCQLYTPDTGSVLIQDATGRPPLLTALIESQEVRKVFHFAPFDLRFLLARWHILGSNVACTKAASKLLAPTAPAVEHSLKALLQAELGVRIDKGAVRTGDWSGVLSDEQVKYASADVEHLLDLFDRQTEQLRVRGLLGVYDEICRYMPVAAQLEVRGVPDPLQY